MKKPLKTKLNLKPMILIWMLLSSKTLNLMLMDVFIQTAKYFRIERINSFGNLETGIHKPVKFHFLSQKSFGQAKDILDKNQHTKKQTSQDKSKFDDEANADIDQEITQLKNIVGEIYTIEDLQISLNTSCSEINITRRNTSREALHEDQPFAGGEGEDEGILPGFSIGAENNFTSSTYQDLSKMLKKIEGKGYKVKQIHNKSFHKIWPIQRA